MHARGGLSIEWWTHFGAETCSVEASGVLTALPSAGIVLGKLSGRNALGTHLKDMGFEPRLEELDADLQVGDGCRLRV